MQNPPGLRVNVLLPTEPQYGRFGESVRPKTMYRIEAVVEWVEEHGWTPFTQAEAWRGSGCGSWPTASKTLLEMRDHGLLRRVNDPKTKPGLWVRFDAPWPNRQVDPSQLSR